MMPSTNGVRDAAGRFQRGNPGGPGNPHARAVARLRARLLEVVTPEALGELAQGLLDAARNGDVAAARLLLSYTIGSPARQEPPDPDRVALDETRLAVEEADAARALRLAMAGHGRAPRR